jgi:hypothetical protein
MAPVLFQQKTGADVVGKIKISAFEIESQPDDGDSKYL